MKLFKRLKFAFTYNIEPSFIVVPYGDKFLMSRFLKYDDALMFAVETRKEQPQFPQPEVLVIVSKAPNPKEEK